MVYSQDTKLLFLISNRYFCICFKKNLKNKNVNLRPSFTKSYDLFKPFKGR